MTALKIIFEDDIILVCDKPAGLMVEPDRNNFPNLLQQVRSYLREKTGTSLPYVQHLHRLDRPVSGLVLFTKNKEFLRPLSEQFAQRIVRKFYVALTARSPEAMSGSLINWHRKEKKKAMLVPAGTEYAEEVKLEYQIENKEAFFLWHIQLHTGKFHQIRAQLAGLGCPILGDSLYGSLTPFREQAIALHACKLVIRHPLSGTEMEFISEAPF